MVESEVIMAMCDGALHEDHAEALLDGVPKVDGEARDGVVPSRDEEEGMKWNHNP